MEKKLFAIECDNVILAVRPNGDTVIVTEATELVLDNAVMEQLVRNSGAYKSFVATKDEILSVLEYENTNLQNEIVGLKEELESVKDANNNDDIHRLKRERIKLRNNIMRLEKELEEAKADKDSLQQKLVNATIRAQHLLQEGKVSPDVVMEIFGNTGLKKSRTANKAELDDFNWDDVPVDGGEK